MIKNNNKNMKMLINYNNNYNNKIHTSNATFVLNSSVIVNRYNIKIKIKIIVKDASYICKKHVFLAKKLILTRC